MLATVEGVLLQVRAGGLRGGPVRDPLVLLLGGLCLTVASEVLRAAGSASPSYADAVALTATRSSSPAWSGSPGPGSTRARSTPCCVAAIVPAALCAFAWLPLVEAIGRWSVARGRAVVADRGVPGRRRARGDDHRPPGGDLPGQAGGLPAAARRGRAACSGPTCRARWRRSPGWCRLRSARRRCCSSASRLFGAAALHPSLRCGRRPHPGRHARPVARGLLMLAVMVGPVIRRAAVRRPRQLGADRGRRPGRGLAARRRAPGPDDLRAPAAGVHRPATTR